MYNKAFLIGRLTRDPEVRYTDAGIPVGRFTLAINRGYRSEEVDFIRIVAWRKLATIIGDLCKKGMLICIAGRLQFSNYVKAGQERTSTEVVADDMQILERKGTVYSGGGDGSSQAQPQTAEQSAPF
ncbi:single-stranded DNA-binding protein [Candidatus Margulisiibacteriota bacterium]